MKFRNRVVFVAGLLLAFTPLAHSTLISSFSYKLTTADFVESGRPSRSGTPQDWTGTETYTGTVAGTYLYQVFTFSSNLFAGAKYIDISTFDPTNGSSYFLTAYLGNYNVNNRGPNWLGDAGFSGNYQTNTGGDFQVVRTPGSDLLLVLNSTASGVLPTYALNIQIDAYADTMYTDPAPVPEPASWLMVGTGLLGGLGTMRRRLFASV